MMRLSGMDGSTAHNNYYDDITTTTLINVIMRMIHRN